MFPGDVIVKLTELSLKSMASLLESRRVDSRRTFGRDLLRFHEAIRTYRYHADELYKILTLPDISHMRKNSYEFHSLLDGANYQSAKLAEALGEMGGVLEPGFRSYRNRESVEKLIGRRFSARAHKRGKVLSIYDDGLEELVARAYVRDTWAINYAQALNEIYFSTKYREVWTYLPGQSDLDAALSYISHRGGLEHIPTLKNLECIHLLSLHLGWPG